MGKNMSRLSWSKHGRSHREAILSTTGSWGTRLFPGCLSSSRGRGHTICCHKEGAAERGGKKNVEEWSTRHSLTGGPSRKKHGMYPLSISSRVSVKVMPPDEGGGASHAGKQVHTPCHTMWSHKNDMQDSGSALAGYSFLWTPALSPVWETVGLHGHPRAAPSPAQASSSLIPPAV